MSESNDAPPPQPPDDPAPSSPFPESSLTPPPLPPQEEPPPSPPAPVSSEPPPPVAVPTPPPPAAAPEPEPRPWMESPAQPAPEPPQPMAPPTGGGLVSGDPLGGSTPAPAPSDFPPGYTSPPPPGAGGFGGSVPSTAPAPGTYVLASWGRRVGAFIIDALVLMIPFFLLVSALGIGFFGDEEGANDGFGGFIAGFLLTSLAFLVVALLYAPVMMSRTNGKTLGRMATGIRVVRASGEPITFGFAAIREIAVKGLLINGIGGAITFGLAWLVDSLWPLWDDENRALHDFVVNTRTVMDQ